MSKLFVIVFAASLTCAVACRKDPVPDESPVMGTPTMETETKPEMEEVPGTTEMPAVGESPGEEEEPMSSEDEEDESEDEEPEAK